ncbi:MAG: phosphodiester glycosidase family protein [Candidatus Sericytochromatia bacterium]
MARTNKFHHFFAVPLLVLLLNCQAQNGQDSGRQFKVKPEDLIKFRPPDVGPPIPSPMAFEAPVAVSSYLPVNKRAAEVLRTPNGYSRTRIFQLSEGILFKQYERLGKGAHPEVSIRALRIEPRAFGKLQVLFSDTAKRPLYFYKVAQRKQTMAIMNWGFFGTIPAGDVLGQRCSKQGLSCKPGLFYSSEKRTGKRTDRRYLLTINRRNQAQIQRGGLGPQSDKWYQLAMGGGILLFDRDLAPPLWFATGRKHYNTLFASSRYNESAIVSNGQAGDVRRSAPRSALGIMADGSLVYMQIGEGKYRLKSGATPARLAVLMKELGCIRALMFDGGGAPVMVVRTKKGQMLSHTHPEHSRTSNYFYNYSFLVLTH